MSRLSRAELQLRTRAKVLAAARAEFAEHGYRDAKVDRIADRADLTRGAVYSNFPGKRALYLTTLADLADTSPGVDLRARGELTASAGLSGFADAWLDRPSPGVDLLPELSDVGPAYAGLLQLDALLLGLSLDRLSPGRLGAMIRASRLALTMLHGAGQLTSSAPGFVEPLAVARVCSSLIDLDDPWTPPPSIAPARTADEAWSPPDVLDAVQRRTANFESAGVVAVLGLNRLAAAEDVVRTTADPVTVALVSSDPAELGPLARHTLARLFGCIRQSMPLPRIQVVHDEAGVLATALGCEVIGTDLEYAVRIAGDRIVARAEGFGAAAAIARTGDSIRR